MPITYFQETYEHISGKHKIVSGAFVWFFVEKLSFTDLSINSSNGLVNKIVLVSTKNFFEDSPTF